MDKAYDFDAIIDRRRTGSLKWSFRDDLCDNPDAIPMWVADMDFACPPEVVDAIIERARHPVYGYTLRTEAYHEALLSWMLRRNRWEIKKEWLCFAPGIVPALNIAVLAYTEPGDAVIVQPPVYYPFFAAAVKNGRLLLENPLRRENGRYRMDFDDLEAKAAQGAKMLILSSPHNPAGRVWEREELKMLGDICLRHGIVIVSDEIHSDILMPGFSHVCLATVDPAFAGITVTCTAPNKTFNIAGIPTGNIIIPDEGLRSAYAAQSAALGLGLGTIFGNVAMEAAYTKGEPWLAELNEYIARNYAILARFVSSRAGTLELAPLEGTYLAWIDCRALGLSDPELKTFFSVKAGVWLDDGAKFGTGGGGFMRMNLACPKSVLVAALDRIDAALSSLL
jgi:cystathionine beta-lyase